MFTREQKSPLRDYLLAQREPLLISDLTKQPAPIPLEPIGGIPHGHSYRPNPVR
jgi:hypothetical protein